MSNENSNENPENNKTTTRRMTYDSNEEFLKHLKKNMSPKNIIKKSNSDKK